MATRERIGGARESERRPAAPARSAPGTRIIYGAFGPGWRRGLFTRQTKPAPGTRIVYGAFGPGWWRGLFTRPKEPVPGGEIVYHGFAPGWWRGLFRRTPPRSPR